MAKERERIIEGRTDDDVLTTFKLTKYYRNITDCFKRLRPAVDELCFGVRKGEVRLCTYDGGQVTVVM